MDNINHFSPEEREARALEKQREDFRDFNNEIADRNTGKMSRFISDEERRKQSGRNPHSDTAKTQLQIAMMNSQYAALYNNVSRSIGDVHHLVYQEMVENSERLAEKFKALEDALEQNVGEEEIERRRKEYKNAQKRQIKLDAFDKELSDYQQRLNSSDNPLAPEELERMIERSEEIKRDTKGEQIYENKFDAKPAADIKVPDLAL